MIYANRSVSHIRCYCCKKAGISGLNAEKRTGKTNVTNVEVNKVTEANFSFKIFN